MMANETKTISQEVVLKFMNNTSITKNVAKEMRSRAKVASLRRFALLPSAISLAAISFFFRLTDRKPIKNGIIAIIVISELIRQISRPEI